MKRVIMIATLMLLPTMVFAQGDSDWEVMGFSQDLHGVVDVTWQGKYIWRGFDIYADNSAVQVTADLDLFGTGLGASVQAHRANTSGFETGERWDYTLYYQNVFFEGQPYATNWRWGWTYYNFPELPRRLSDLQEFHWIFTMPSVTGIKGLVPSYVLVKLWPARGNSQVGGNASGFAHILMMDYSFPIPGPFPETPEQIINLHSELVFNDGVSPAGTNVDHDWSNFVIGGSTDFDLGYGITLTPAVWYQMAMESTVNPDDDEVWATVGLKSSF